MRKLIFCLALLTLSLASRPVFADAIGTTVTGTLLFAGDPPNNRFNLDTGGVPPGYGNSISNPTTIGSGVEFAYQDFFNLDTADFTGNTLTITDVVSFATGAFEMDFTDTYFTGFTMLDTSDPGFSFAFSGNTLKVFYAGIHTPGTYTANFTFTGGSDGPPTGIIEPTAVTPEPSSILMLGTGALAAAGAVRRRFLTR